MESGVTSGFFFRMKLIKFIPSKHAAMKKFVVFFVLALTFAGCSTDDTADVPEGILQKVIVTPFAANEQYTTRYYYDGHKLDRTESTNDTKEIYYYDGDLIVNIKMYNDTYLVRERQYQYDDSDRLVQFLTIDHITDYRNKSMYVYNPGGSVTESNYSFYTGGPETLNYTREFFFAGQEVSYEVITFANGSGTQTNAYTYDDKLVPEHDIVGFDKIRALNPSGYMGIYHNIVDVTQTYSSSSAIDTYSHLWSYNNQGAPTFFTFDDNGTIIIDAGTVQYFYK
jgi:hypothetical protein